MSEEVEKTEETKKEELKKEKSDANMTRWICSGSRGSWRGGPERIRLA